MNELEGIKTIYSLGNKLETIPKNNKICQKLQKCHSSDLANIGRNNIVRGQGRVAGNFDFFSEGPKIFPKPLSHSIFCADRKYGVRFSIRPREDMINRKLKFYPYRIFKKRVFLKPKLFGA